LGIEAKVHEGRAESLPELFDCVTLRAVDRMAEAVKAGGMLTDKGGWLAVMTTDGELEAVKAEAGKGFRWEQKIRLAGSENRLLALGRRVDQKRVNI
jgi:16S rRNA (guanine527-N7)-methyltransferase